MYRSTLATLALLGAVAAQNATDTVALPLMAFDQQAIHASILDSDADATTYSLECVDPTADTCGIPPSFTVTAGPSTVHYAIVLTTVPGGGGVDAAGPGSLSLEYGCQLTGTTAASCSVTNEQSFDGQSTSTQDTATLTESSELGYVTVRVVNAAAASNTATTTTASSGKKSSGGSASESESAAGDQATGNAAVPMARANAQWVVGAGAALALAAW